MVLGIILLAAAIPTTIGTAEAISANKTAQDPKNAEKRGQYCSLTVYCSAKSRKRKEVDGKAIVLRDGKLFVGGGPGGVPFDGFYINYPNDEKPMGLVSMTSVQPPSMGWIYVDRGTLEVRYGNRTASLEHVVGPWDWTDDEAGVTLEGKEGFVAVEEEEGVWGVYFDRGGDWEKLPKGRRLEISVERVVKEVEGGEGKT